MIMRIRFSEGTASIQDMIKELQCVEKYLTEIAEKGNQIFHIKSADLYIRIYNEDDTQTEIADKDHNIKAIEFRVKPYKTAKNVKLIEQTDISEDKTAYMYETNNSRWE